MDVNYVLQRMQCCRLLWSPLYELWHKTDTIWVTSPSDTCSMQTADLQTRACRTLQSGTGLLPLVLMKTEIPTKQTWTSRTQIWDDALTCQSHASLGNTNVLLPIQSRPDRECDKDPPRISWVNHWQCLRNLPTLTLSYHVCYGVRVQNYRREKNNTVIKLFFSSCSKKGNEITCYISPFSGSGNNSQQWLPQHRHFVRVKVRCQA